jgi:hypothetical protein
LKPARARPVDWKRPPIYNAALVIMQAETCRAFVEKRKAEVMKVHVPASRPAAAKPSRKPRPWFTSIEPPPDIIPFHIQRLNRERVHRAVGAVMKQADWFATSIVADIGHEYSEPDSMPSFRRRPFLVLATTLWRGPWRSTRFDLAIAPCGEAEREYYAQPVSPEIAKYAFQKYIGFARYKVVLSAKGTFVDTHQKWGQQ